MKVHHLNCGTMRPPATPGGLVCHVLLVEGPGGLVLVDSGLGLQDVRSPAKRFGSARFYVRPVFDPDEAAINRVRALGFDPKDVRDIVLTHFDADHVGGLADFPWARVHLTAAEAFAMKHPRSIVEKGRYLPACRAHGPNLIEHTPEAAESWRGFPGAQEILDGIVLINLPGHSRGHAGVAVDNGDRWILHTGDAFYHHGQLDGSHTAPKAITAMERLIAHDWAKVQGNHQRLSELWAGTNPICCSSTRTTRTFYRGNDASKPCRSAATGSSMDPDVGVDCGVCGYSVCDTKSGRVARQEREYRVSGGPSGMRQADRDWSLPPPVFARGAFAMS